MIEPSGDMFGYEACTAGKGKQITKPFLEKGFDGKKFKEMTEQEALPQVAKM